MMNIDWSKAPEDATHARKGSGGGNFYRYNDDFWQLWCGTEWVRSFDWEGWESAPACFVEKPNPWPGSGLPPVGTVCEIHHTCWELNDWQVSTVNYISSEYLIVDEGAFKREQHFHMSDMSFRPLRTAEQIAAEKREKAILEIVEDIGFMVEGGIYQAAENLYDANYRKQDNGARGSKVDPLQIRIHFGKCGPTLGCHCAERDAEAIKDMADLALGKQVTP